MGPALDGYTPPLLVIGAVVLLVALRSLFILKYRQCNAWWADLAIMLAVIAFAGFLEIQMGRTPTYKHGPVKLWSGEVYSNENSQQIADPYTFTHVIHGAGFYGLIWFARSSLSLGLRAIIAVTLESAWEVLENTDMVINRYRAETISLDYYGDSVINSVFDILACVLGFVLAWYSPRWVTIVWILLVEVILAVWIRDNLTLNIIMLLYPLRAIRTWQMGG